MDEVADKDCHSANRDTKRPLDKRTSHDEAITEPKATDIMTQTTTLGKTAMVLHWLVVALLMCQYPLGKFMPDIIADDAGRCDDVPIFPWDRDPALMGLALFWPHHPSRRAGRFASGPQRLISERCTGCSMRSCWRPR